MADAGRCRIFYRCVDWNSFGVHQRKLSIVASFTDAWIETEPGKQTMYRPYVASFTDAWIETIFLRYARLSGKSHLLQMRGLKPQLCTSSGSTRKSHLLQMRGLKHSITEQRKIPLVASFTDAWIETKPKRKAQAHCKVASFTDAWIETFDKVDLPERYQCRIFYRCVDWNNIWQFIGCLLVVASFTDAWIETLQRENSTASKCRIFYRCVDWNKMWRWKYTTQSRRIFYRCVDWNVVLNRNRKTSSQSHLLQMRGLKPSLKKLEG